MQIKRLLARLCCLFDERSKAIDEQLTTDEYENILKPTKQPTDRPNELH